MRIAVFYYLKFSGAKRVVMEHVKGLESLGHEIDLYTTDSEKDIFDPSKFASKKYFYSFNPNNLNIPLLGRVKHDFIDTFILLKMLHKDIAKDIDSRKYDIVLVHTDINTQAPFLLRYLKSKNVYFCLEPLRNGYEYGLNINEKLSFPNRLYENLNRWIRKRIDLTNTLSADNFITISLFARERMIAAYNVFPKISYIGVDEKIFKPKKTKKDQILFVANKETIYGYDLLEKAIAMIPKNARPKVKIVSWNKNNNKRLSDSELVNEYNRSFALLSLSKFDTFGLTALEAMSCGIPVIAVNAAGYREIVKDGVTGYLVDFDPKQIADKIVYIKDNYEIAKKMGNMGRSIVCSNWSWTAQINVLNSVLTKIKSHV